MDRRRRRFQVPEAALALAALALFLVSCNSTYFGQYVDDANWVLLAEQLLKGSFLRAWRFPPQLEVSMNPGVSLFLAPLVAALGRNLLALKAFMSLLTFSGLFLFYLATRSRESVVERCAYLSLLFACDFMLTFAGGVMSEAPFVFLFGLSVFLLFERGWRERDDAGRWAVLGALTGLMTLTRSLGALFAAAVLLDLLPAGKRRRALVYAAAAAAFILPYSIYLKLHIGRASFYEPYWALRLQGGAGAFVSGTWSNALFYLKGLSCLSALNLPALDPAHGLLKGPVMAAAAALLASAAWSGRRDARVRFLTVYGAAFALVLAAYAYREPRYAAPLYPVFVFLVFQGLREALPAKRRTAGLAVLAALGLASNAGDLVRTARRSLARPVAIPHASDDWLKARAIPGERVVSMDMVRIHFFTGLTGELFLDAPDPAAFAARARALGARYLVLDAPGFVGSTPGVRDPTLDLHARLAAFASDPALFAEVYRNDAESVRIYALR